MTTIKASRPLIYSRCKAKTKPQSQITNCGVELGANWRLGGNYCFTRPTEAGDVLTKATGSEAGRAPLSAGIECLYVELDLSRKSSRRAMCIDWINHVARI